MEYIWKDGGTPAFYGTACRRCLATMDRLDSVWSVGHVRAEVAKLAKGKAEGEELAARLQRIGEDLRSALEGLAEALRPTSQEEQEKAELIEELLNGPVDSLAYRKVKFDRTLSAQLSNNHTIVEASQKVQTFLQEINSLRQNMAVAANRPGLKGQPQTQPTLSQRADLQIPQPTLSLAAVLEHIKALKERLEGLKNESGQADRLEMEVGYYKQRAEQNYVRNS